jgi:NADPH:quinone reductase-like Zn-dependent oxidoreductase
MKRIQYDRYGGAAVMHLAHADPPRPGPGQVAVRVRAASLNPIDWKVRLGNLKFVTGRKFPRVMGQDFSGVVHEVGAGVTRFKDGDEVFGIASLRDGGAFAEVVVTSEDFVTPKPSGVSFEQAACLPTAGVTAWNALVDIAHLQRGQRVFVGGCMGSVGQALVQIAREAGAIVHGSCRKSDMYQARAIGIDEAYDYADLDYTALRDSFDVVVDTSFAIPIRTKMSLLRKGGLVPEIDAIPKNFLRSVFSRKLKIVICKPSGAILSALAAAAAAHRLKIAVGKRATLGDAIDLISDVEHGTRVGGKALLVMK